MEALYSRSSAGWKISYVACSTRGYIPSGPVAFAGCIPYTAFVTQKPLLELGSRFRERRLTAAYLVYQVPRETILLRASLTILLPTAAFGPFSSVTGRFRGFLCSHTEIDTSYRRLLVEGWPSLVCGRHAFLHESGADTMPTHFGNRGRTAFPG